MPGGLASATAVLILVAAVKGNSANHALLIFIDGMVALLVGSLPLGREARRCKEIAATTGKLPQMSTKPANLIVLLIVTVGTVLIIGEYALAYYK